MVANVCINKNKLFNHGLKHVFQQQNAFVTVYCILVVNILCGKEGKFRGLFAVNYKYYQQKIARNNKKINRWKGRMKLDVQTYRNIIYLGCNFIEYRHRIINDRIEKSITGR